MVIIFPSALRPLPYISMCLKRLHLQLMIYLPMPYLHLDSVIPDIS